MNKLYPIYTLETECQDCYKCVRHCPVKAIKVKDGHATVVPELCIACGHCVQICPAKAKKVRNDLNLLKQLIKEKPVYASLAPSWVSENDFSALSSAEMTFILKKLGFTGVSETALGAQEISAGVVQELKNNKAGIFLSSACPAAVEFIRKYHPEHVKNITGLLSPVLAHAKLLKERYGEDIAVVMIGPCIAKKTEADKHHELLDISITFEDLRDWIAEAGIDYRNLTPGETDNFVPEKSAEGAIYPVEGGMLETIKAHRQTKHIKGITLTGIDNINEALNGIDEDEIKDVLFVELLACHGGCVNGPCASADSPCLTGRMKVLAKAELPEDELVRAPQIQIEEEYLLADNSNIGEWGENQIIKALESVGKFSIKDELNCGGCGYENCRNFAKALLDGRAEPAMCVSYLKKQAQKKANALLRCIPSGVVIVDATLKIIECNERFAQMFDEGTQFAYAARPGLCGADLNKIVDFSELFENALYHKRDYHRDSYKYKKRLLNITIFNIDPGQTAGAVITDVTDTEMKRELIARRAREVINRNLETVQEIACQLGEHMADTELLLRSIADDYADESPKPGELS
jgi:iron only hydrogenase large subunit-like protein